MKRTEPSAAAIPASNRPDWLILMVQLVLSIAMVVRVGGTETFRAYHAPLQMLAYLVLFNLAGLVFQHLTRPFLSKKMFIGLLCAAGASLLYIYLVSYSPVLDLNGDNAGYLTRAKSLLMGKGFRDLWFPSEPFDATLKSAGFSLLNIPFIVVFGFDNYPGLEILELASTFLGLFFFFKYFEDKMPRNLLFLTVLMLALQSQIIHFSSNIMTESVAFACLFGVLFMADRLFLRPDSPAGLSLKTVLQLLLLGLLCFLSFTVREAMIGLLAVVPLFFLLKKKFFHAVIVGLVIALCMGGFMMVSRHLKELNMSQGLISEAASGSFVAQSFLNTYLAAVLSAFKSMEAATFGKAFLVLSQKLAGDPDRYEYGNILLNLVILAVVFTGIIRRIFVEKKLGLHDIFFFIFILTIIFFWPNKVDYVVYSRYFFILIGLVFFYYITGLSFLVGKIRFLPVPLVVFLVAGLHILFFFQMNTQKVYSSKYPYPPAVQNYVTACKWIRANTPADSVIASRKSTMAFLWADRKSLHYFDDVKYNRYMSYSPQFDQDTLDYYAREKIRFVILDAFSSDAYDKILPVIKNHPAMFKVLYATPQPQTYVIEVVRP